MAISDLRIRIGVDRLGLEHWNQLVGRVEAMQAKAHASAQQQSATVPALLASAAVASASTRKFSRRALFRLLRRD